MTMTIELRSFAAALMLLALSSAPALSADSAAILLYHRFGEDTLPSTNIKLDAFESHIKELTSGRYTVLPLGDILDAIRAGRSLPDRAVAITIDDGYASTYTEAWPRFKAAGLPFTVFVSTALIDSHTKGAMTWDQIREMNKAGVTIGGHSTTHPHMVEGTDAQNRNELATANKRMVDELGHAPDLFAYPYGEASARVMSLAKEAGYRFALGQHSGVAHATMNDFFVPRFAVNESYGDLARIRLVLNALPLPVADVTPTDPAVGAQNPPAPGFTIAADIPRLDALSCFASSEGRARIETLGARRIEVRLAKPLPVGRTRLNCTLPGPDNRWRWFGMAFYVPKSAPPPLGAAGMN